MVSRLFTPFELHHRLKYLLITSNKGLLTPLANVKNFPYAVDYADAVMVTSRGSLLNQEIGTLLLGLLDGCHDLQDPLTTNTLEYFSME